VKITAAAAGVLLAAVALAAPSGAAVDSTPPALAAVAAELHGVTGPTEVVLVFGQGSGLSHRATLRTLGVATTAYRELPMAVATLDAAGIERARHLRGLTDIQPSGTAGRWLSDRSMPTVRAEQERAAKSRGLGYDGTGIGVAVLDTGVDGTHPDLHYPEHLVQNVVVRGRGPTSTPYDVIPDVLPPVYGEGVADTDYLGHGTHTAGIAAANGSKYPGVAPGAHVVSLAANENASVPYVLASFDYVLSHPQYNIKVVNCSFGVLKPYDAKAPINVAQKALHDKGITVVWAAGNSGPAAGTTSAWAQSPYAIGVAMGDPDGRVRGDSSRGFPADPKSWPTLTAPGDNLTVASAKASVFGAGAPGSDYETESGTSAAAPMVAGTVALMQQAAKARLKRYLLPDEVKTILTRTATPLGGYQPWEAGAGMLDAYAAVDAVVHGLSHYGVGPVKGSGVVRSFDAVSADMPVTPPMDAGVEFSFTVSEPGDRLDVVGSWTMPEADWHMTVTGPKGEKQEMDRFPAGYLTGLVDAISFLDPKPGKWTVSFRLAQGEVISRPDHLRVRAAVLHTEAAALPRDIKRLAAADRLIVERAIEAGWIPSSTACGRVTRDGLAAALARAATVRQIPGAAGYSRDGGAATAPGAALRDWYWGDGKRFPQLPLVAGSAHAGATRADLARAVVRALASPDVARAKSESVTAAHGLGVLALRLGGGVKAPYEAASEPLTWAELARALDRLTQAAARDGGSNKLTPPPAAARPC
jgi:serine protease AprX